MKIQFDLIVYMMIIYSPTLMYENYLRYVVDFKMGNFKRVQRRDTQIWYAIGHGNL